MKAVESEVHTRAFGYRIGELHTDPPVYPYDVAIDNPDFACVFVRLRGWWDPPEPVTALAYLYEMEFRLPGPLDIPALTVQKTASEEHLEIARTAFRDSRFLLDWKLHELSDETYARWIAGKSVHVLRDSPDMGFMYVTEEEGARRISLVAVHQRDRGMGAGRLLVFNVIGSIGGTWRVKVYCKNHRAVRFYENIGFRVKGIETVFHVWTGRKRPE